MSFIPLVELRPSGIHGRGVFAKNDISKGQLMCYYGCIEERKMDILVKEGKLAYSDTKFNLTNVVGDLKVSDEESKQIVDEYKNYDISAYALGINGKSFYGDPIVRDSFNIGQFANDPIKTRNLEFIRSMARTNNWKNIVKAVIQYDLETFLSGNMDVRTTPDKKTVECFAKNDIEANSEVLFTYCIWYWLRDIAENKENVTKARFAYKILKDKAITKHISNLSPYVIISEMISYIKNGVIDRIDESNVSDMSTFTGAVANAIYIFK